MTSKSKNILIGLLLIIAGALFIVPLFHILAIIIAIVVIVWGVWLIVKGIRN